MEIPSGGSARQQQTQLQQQPPPPPPPPPTSTPLPTQAAYLPLPNSDALPSPKIIHATPSTDHDYTAKVNFFLGNGSNTPTDCCVVNKLCGGDGSNVFTECSVLNKQCLVLFRFHRLQIQNTSTASFGSLTPSQSVSPLDKERMVIPRSAATAFCF